MATKRPDPSAYRAFEHTGWEKATPQYHNAFGALTAQAIQPLLDTVDVRRGMRLLDVATGPGYVAAAAAQRGASVVGIDFSAAMVAEARRCYPALVFQEGDAEDLPFPDKSFDAVVMNFGLLHLERPEQALAEAPSPPGGRKARLHGVGQARGGHWIRYGAMGCSRSWKDERAAAARPSPLPVQ